MGSCNRLLSVLALLAACAYCISGQCPPPEEMPQVCDCSFDEGTYVSCVGNKNSSNNELISTTIEEIASALGEKFPADTATIQSLELTDFVTPSKLSSRTFEGLRIKELSIIGGNIVSWADEFGGPAFVELEDCLEVLEIMDVIKQADEHDCESELPAPFSLGHLHRLKKVVLNYNNVFVFGDDWFGKGGASVEELDLQFNEICLVGKEALVGLTNMREFKIRLNEIKELTRSMFPPVSKVVDLDLRFNQLEGFEEDFFTNFTSLESLNLVYNPIKYLSQNVFGKIWSQLKYFELWGSELQCDDHINWMLDVKQPDVLDVMCNNEPPQDPEDLRDVLRKRKQGE